jgi:peptidoglycan hydrolase CwlO-like protein
MKRRIKSCLVIALSLLLVPVLIIVPIRVSGEVQPITEMEDKLEGISEEEKAVLEELFAISQEIEVMEREEAEINGEIDTLHVQITDIQSGIEEKQKDYNLQLDILEKVLVNYQRGGPASYLEILLSADNLTEFLKSINIIKDISRNVGELLVTIEDGKKVLQEEKDRLDEKESSLELKKVELQENLHKNQLLKQEQEEYLASLQEKQEFYQEQLVNLEMMWDDSLELFADIVVEITRIVGAGYFTLEDLNLEFGFTKMNGAILEDTFNNKLKENSNLSETIFRFQSKQVVIEVPEKHLVLTGDFILAGETAIQFEVEEGSFYDMPLEASSIEELFQNGPLLIDFKKITGDMIILEFTLTQVESQEGKLTFEIKLKW